MPERAKGKVCTYCKRQLERATSRARTAATKDHTIPASLGGTKKVWSCRQCNEIKSAMLPAAWEKFMADNPGWWKRDEFRRYGAGYKVWVPDQVTPTVWPWLSELYSWSRANSTKSARSSFRDR